MHIARNWKKFNFCWVRGNLQWPLWRTWSCMLFVLLRRFKLTFLLQNQGVEDRFSHFLCILWIVFTKNGAEAYQTAFFIWSTCLNEKIMMLRKITKPWQFEDVDNLKPTEIVVSFAAVCKWNYTNLVSAQPRADSRTKFKDRDSKLGDVPMGENNSFSEGI